MTYQLIVSWKTPFLAAYEIRQTLKTVNCVKYVKEIFTIKQIEHKQQTNRKARALFN